MQKKDFELIIKTRDEVVFQGFVNSLSSTNKKGKFDVLARHANFITLVEQRLEIREGSGAKREIDVDLGLVRVLKDRVEVFLGIKQIFSKEQNKQIPTTANEKT